MFGLDSWPNVGGVNCTSHKSRPLLRFRRVAKLTLRIINLFIGDMVFPRHDAPVIITIMGVE